MSNTRKAKDVLLGKAKLPEKKVSVYLRGHLVSQIQDAERELATARDGWERTKLADADPAKPIAERIEALREEMKASEVVLTLRAIKPQRKSDLLAAHPPKDLRLRFDPDGFFPELVQACCVDPEFDSVEEVKQFFEEVGSAQADTVSDAAWSLVNDQVSVPFSVAASVLTQNSEQK